MLYSVHCSAEVQRFIRRNRKANNGTDIVWSTSPRAAVPQRSRKVPEPAQEGCLRRGALRLGRRPAQGRLAVYEDGAVRLQHLRVALLRPSARLVGRRGRAAAQLAPARPDAGGGRRPGCHSWSCGLTYPAATKMPRRFRSPARAVLGEISVRHHACKDFTQCLLIIHQASQYEPATILHNGYTT